MTRRRPSSPRQLARLVEELAEEGLDLDGSMSWHALAIDEIDYALRPAVHERRVPTFGAVINPLVEVESWSEASQLLVELRPVGATALSDARRYADGMSSWLIRRIDGDDEWAIFNRPASSERDMVVLAEAFGAVVVQRHPAGAVRVAGDFGVFRWDGLGWQHEPPVSHWIDAMAETCAGDECDVLVTLLEFAVHDLGAWGIGATLVYRPDKSLETSFDARLDIPPRLRITRSSDLAPLRHVLGQIDGATLFDASGTLRRIGVRLVPTPGAETDIEGLKGTRHTSGLRYSYDDPSATVIVVSEDGPVTVLRAGSVLGSSGSRNGRTVSSH